MLSAEALGVFFVQRRWVHIPFYIAAYMHTNKCVDKATLLVQSSVPWPCWAWPAHITFCLIAWFPRTNSCSANWMYDMLLRLLWIALVYCILSTISVNIIVLRYVEVSLRSINAYLRAFVQEPTAMTAMKEFKKETHFAEHSDLAHFTKYHEKFIQANCASK